MLSRPASPWDKIRLREGRESMAPNMTRFAEEWCSMNPPYRKLVRSYNEPGHAHELTFSCFRRLPLFSRDRTRQWFLEALESTRQRRNLTLLAYVIMPEHVHVIVCPRDPDYEVRLIRTALKVPVQRKALAFLRREAPGFLEQLRDAQPNGEVHYRFWQRGGGYDRNITDPATLMTMIDYIHQNPVRRGLVSYATDWLWSSARYYEGMPDVLLRMDPLPTFGG
jgi:putative transposase